MSIGKDASTGEDGKQFKSPLSKLVTFFRESRDGWKAKAQKMTEKWRKAHVQMRAVERSRRHWKKVARQEKEKRKQVERELAEQKNFLHVPSSAVAHG